MRPRIPHAYYPQCNTLPVGVIQTFPVRRVVHSYSWISCIKVVARLLEVVTEYEKRARTMQHVPGFRTDVRCCGMTEVRTGFSSGLHNEELSYLYSLPNIVRVVKSRRMRWAGHVARMEEGRGVGKPEGKRPLGRPRRRWEDNIKMDLQEVGCEDWMELAQDRDRWRALVGTVMNLRVRKMRGIS